MLLGIGLNTTLKYAVWRPEFQGQFKITGLTIWICLLSQITREKGPKVMDNQKLSFIA